MIITVLEDKPTTGHVCGMTTWLSHFTNLVSVLGHTLYIVPKEEIHTHVSESNPDIVIIGRETDWMDLLDLECNKWYYYHNAYHLTDEDPYIVYNDESTRYADILSTIDNIIAPSPEIARLSGGVYVPQPYMRANIQEDSPRNGLLMIGDDLIKQVKPIQRLADVTVMAEASREEVDHAIQTHSALIHNSAWETGCYAVLECDGIIPIYVDEDTTWWHNFQVPVIPIKMTAENLSAINKNSASVRPSTYMDEVITAWRDFFNNQRKQNG